MIRFLSTDATHAQTFESRNFQSFGDVAAEDDAVLDYFLRTSAVSDLESNSRFLVLGRKGAGKTAIVRYFTEGAAKGASRPLNLRGYPWNIHAQRVDGGASEIEAYVASWRYLISLELALLAYSEASNSDHESAKALKQFLDDNYGGTEPALGDILKPGKLRLNSFSFEPEILGCKLGSVDLERQPSDLRLGSELVALADSLLTTAISLARTHNIPSLFLHVDELDQGLSSIDEQRTRMLVGLILAAREVRNRFTSSAVAINPIVYLRTDLWEELRFSDKNKISQTLALNLEWSSESLLAVVNERLRARLAPDANWEQITTDGLMRGSQTKWNHILSRTFLRPRDVIAFLNAALERAKRRDDDPVLLDNPDVISAREKYSHYLKAELDDEIIAHWPHWEEALQACSALNTITFHREHFVSEYEQRRSSENTVAAQDALRALHQYSVIGYGRRSGYGGSSWAFRYTNPEAGWDSLATTLRSISA